MDYKDYYKVLRVDHSASQDEIKAAYRKLARKFHPDINKDSGAEAKFQDLGEAYEVLKDAGKRAAYDQLGSGWQEGQKFQGSPDWNEGYEYSGNAGNFADQAKFSDFFDTQFGRTQAAGQGQRGRREFHAPGQDHHAKVVIDLKDSYQGGTSSISLSAPQVDANGHISVKQRSVKVKIPRGITDGQHIRLAGQGAPGIGNGMSGDLYLEVHFRPDPLFKVVGLDVYLDLPVTPWEAALGAKLKIPTPSGMVDLKIPLNARSGQKLRLKGKGIPGSPPGDLYAVLQIVIPKAKTPKDREFYQQMAREMDFDPRAKLRG